MNIPTQNFIQNDYGFELIDLDLSNLNKLIFKYHEDNFDLISKKPLIISQNIQMKEVSIHIGKEKYLKINYEIHFNRG